MPPVRLTPRAFYDEAYRTADLFHYNERMYRAYVKTLVAVARLKKGAAVLDAGCGQGLFTRLFAAEGMQVFSTDVSLVGLQQARARYGPAVARPFVSDLYRSAIRPDFGFDCVFVRSCSLYNTDRVDSCVATTQILMSLVRVGGLMILAYNTNLSGQGENWRQHRLEEMRLLLRSANVRYHLYFISRIDTVVLGRLAFSNVVTAINEWISRNTGIGGEIVAVIRKD